MKQHNAAKLRKLSEQRNPTFHQRRYEWPVIEFSFRMNCFFNMIILWPEDFQGLPLCAETLCSEPPITSNINSLYSL